MKPILTKFLNHLKENDPTFVQAIRLPETHQERWNRTPVHTLVCKRHTDLAIELISMVPEEAGQRRDLMRSKTGTNSNLLYVAASWMNVEFVQRLLANPGEFSLDEDDVGEMLEEICTLG